MIRIVRGPCPDSLNGPDSKGGRETIAAIAAIESGGKFSGFEAYKERDVVAALMAMTHGKCAYCEFEYGASVATDVEHFRPKGGVVIDGRVTEPGYYWLAADWTNLLPSCPDCNRARTYEFANGDVRVAGKACYFPIEKEADRWTRHCQDSTENCLLINPCECDPDDHLEFMPGGLVRPKLQECGLESSSGRTTIEVIALLRPALVASRARREKKVRYLLISALECCMEAQRETEEREKRKKLDESSKWLEGARMYLQAPEAFQATVRAVFREFGLDPSPPARAT